MMQEIKDVCAWSRWTLWEQAQAHEPITNVMTRFFFLHKTKSKMCYT